MELEGEYLSHQTALFLLGQIPDLPATLTAVSPRRRRHRTVGGRPLVFVFHPEEKTRHLQIAAFQQAALPVSTLEKTLLDLLADMHHAPPLPELAGLFVRLPYNPGALLTIARQVSDTVLKRACYFTAWAGRARADELPFGAFKRTPVKLDPRVTDQPLLWDSRFFLKVPAGLLALALPEPPANLDADLASWIELRRMPAFRDWIAAQGRIPILGEAASAALDPFWETLFLNLSPSSLDDLLVDHFGRSSDSGPPRPFPIRFNRWLDEHPDVLERRRDELEDWIKRNLASPSINRVETALHLGCLLGLDDLVIEHFALQAYNLYNAGRFDLINRVTGRYLAQDRPLPHYFYVIAARTMARQDRFDEAIAVIDRGKAIYEAREHAELECGELAFVAGNVFRLMNRMNEAMAELILAREFYAVARDRRRLASADCSLGNLYFVRGMAQEARRHYLAGLAVMKDLGERSAQASLLGNLGLVEYDSGHFRRAALFLQQSVNLHRSLKNTWNQAIAALSLGKVFLKMGQFSKAMRILRECHTLKSQQSHESGVLETTALLAWLCELLGNTAAAKAWWDMIPDLEGRTLEPRARFVITAVRAMTALYKGEFLDAERLYASMLETSRQAESSDVEGGDCLHGLAFCQAMRGDPRAPDTLAEAERRFARFPHCSQLVQIRLLGALLYPERFPHVDLDAQIAAFLDTQAYEPFWAFLAEPMMQRGSPGSRRFIEYHLQKTPAAMLTALLARHRSLGKVVQAVEARRRRAAEFFTCLEDGLTRPIHHEEYEAWRREYPRDRLVFDGPAGLLVWREHVAWLKPGSIPHGILSQLLIALPHPVDVDALYHAVWQTVFDPETDVGAFKSSIQRLQKILRSVTPAAKVRRKKTRSRFGGVTISLSCPWTAIL